MLNSIPLSYYLPKTVLKLAAHMRFVVVVDDQGGHLEPQVAATLGCYVVPDTRARCSATIDASVLEKNSLAIELSANGLIAAIGSVPAATAAPSSTGALLIAPQQTSVSMLPVPGGLRLDPTNPESWTSPGSLRTVFSRTHPRTAALIADLSSRADQFLAGLRMSDQATEVLAFGSALEVVERELAAADRMRREWIALQGFAVRSDTWQIDVPSTVTVRGDVGDKPPATLPADTPVPPEQAVAARDHGLLVAVVDAHTPDAKQRKLQLDRRDELLMRRARPVTVAVYRRIPEGVDGFDPKAAWTLDKALVTSLDVVDANSTVDVLAPDAGLFGDRAVHVGFYPDGSLRSFGVSAVMSPFPTSGTRSAEPATTAGGIAAADVAAAALEAARLQLDLLHVGDEFTKLAATHAHRGELASLEQDARFAAMRTGRR